MKELPLYNGEAPQTPQVQVQKPGAIPALPMWGQNVNAAINAVGDALVKYEELEDYGTAAEIGRKRKELTARANRDFTEKARLPWGAEGSFYNEDGTRNEDEIRAFAAKWEEENEKLGTGRFWLRKNAMKAAEEKEDFSVGFALEVDKNILKGEQENRERLFKDNYDSCLANEDYAGGAAEVDKAVAGGMITKARGEVMKIKLAKARAKGSGKNKGTVSVKDMDDAMLASLVEPEDEGTQVAPGEAGKPMEVGEEEEEDKVRQVMDAEGEMEEPGKVEGGGLTEEKQEEPSMDELLKVTEEDLTLGRDPWDKPEVLKVGFGAMTPDEVGEQWMRLGTEAGKVRAVATDDGVGRMRLEIPEAAEEPMAAVSHAANRRGGMTMEDYRKGVYATMCEIVTNPDFAGLSDTDMKKLMVGRTTITGLEEQLFAGLPEEDRQPAMDALINGIADNVISTRGDHIKKRVDAVFAGAEGLPGTKKVMKDMDDASIMALYQQTDAEKALLNYSWWDILNTSEAQKHFQYATSKLWNEYMDRFAAETGTEVEGKLTDNNVRKFRDWYAETIIPEKRAAYVEEAKWVCTQAAIDAVVEYRRNGGSNWAEENEKMLEAISRARENLKGGGDIKAWREEKEKTLAKRAARYRQEAADYKPMMEKARAEVEPQGQVALERAKWEESTRKAALKKQWNEELKEQQKQQHPYQYPVVKRVRYAAGDKDEAVVTIPEEEYAKIVQDLKVGNGEGVVCKFGNGTKKFAVRPGKGKDVTYNLATIRQLYNNKRLKKEEIKKLVNPHNREMRFSKITKMN